jgi:hypothetical protein
MDTHDRILIGKRRNIMKMLIGTIFLIATSILFAGCGGTVEKSSAVNANAPAANAPAPAKPAPPTSEALLAIEKKSWEDWNNKDSKGIDSFMAANFVTVGYSGASERPAALKSWTEHKCEMKDLKFTDENVTSLADGVALLTFKADADIKCDGVAGPNPVWASTLYVKEGEAWKAAYYQETPAEGSKGSYGPVQEKKDVPQGTAQAPAAEIAALENKLWETWKNRDDAGFSALVSDKYVGNGRNGRIDKAQLMKLAFDPACKIESYSLDAMKSISLSKDVVLVFYKGNQKGTCGKDAIPPVVMATSIHANEGGTWKNIYYMETPTK